MLFWVLLPWAMAAIVFALGVPFWWAVAHPDGNVARFLGRVFFDA